MKLHTSWAWKQETTGSKVFIICCYLVMALIALVVLIPLLYVLQVTFSSDVTMEFRLWPKQFTLMHYQQVFQTGLVTRPFLNSVYVTTVSVLLSMLLTVMMAYPLSRRNLVGVKTLNFILMFPMMFSLGFIPGYMLVKDLHLMNSYWALILTGALNTTNVIIMRNFFSAIPESLIESAELDGASEMRILFRIVVPLSKPSIASVALFYLVSSWNEYFNVILYIRDKAKYTIQVVLRQIVMANESIGGNVSVSSLYEKNRQYAVVVIAMIPVLMVYPFAQKHFTKGIMMGSVKG